MLNSVNFYLPTTTQASSNYPQRQNCDSHPNDKEVQTFAYKLCHHWQSDTQLARSDICKSDANCLGRRTRRKAKSSVISDEDLLTVKICKYQGKHQFEEFLPYSTRTIFTVYFFAFILFAFGSVASAKHRTVTLLPLMVPIRYDLQIQLPTASANDPLVPTFFGSVRIDFQLTRTVFANSASIDAQHAAKSYWQSPKFTDRRFPSSSTPFDGVELRLASQNLDSFENVTIRSSGSSRAIPIAETRFRSGEAIFTVKGRKALSPGRYTINIERFQGLITYQKGIYYRDAGGFPVLGLDLFPNYTHTVFPCIGGPLTKTTVKLALIHPRDTVALSNMHQREAPYQLNDNWRVTKFVQAPNLAAYMFSLAVLPLGVYDRTVVIGESGEGFTKLPIHIWTNRIIHRASLKQELARIAVRVYAKLFELLNEPLPLAHLDVLAMNDFNGTHSFGIVTISYVEWDTADEAHRIALMARNFARQWFGGVTTIATFSQFCTQEDIVDFLVSKVVRKLLNDSPKAMEQYFLAHYIRLHIAETFLAPGESVAMAADNLFTNAITQQAVSTHCGLKGAQMLYSLETVATESKNNSKTISNGTSFLLRKLRHIIKFQRYKAFALDDILDHLRGRIVDAIDLAQVYEFWFRSGGIPNVLVEKHGERLRLTQLNRRRSAQVDAGAWAPMPLWPLRVALRNVSLPISFLTSQALELAPLDHKLLPLTNVDFEHWYRVNYDEIGWERILRNFGASLTGLTARSRAQLLNDFCYFNAVGQVDASAAEVLRKGFMRVMRDHYEHFELCELYAFWCVGGLARKINMDATATRAYFELARDRLWPALRNGRNYECGGPGAASDAANELCQLVFGANCI